MATDVEIDRSSLEHAILVLANALGRCGAGLEDAWRRDTGVENPCGRTQLRVMLENAIGRALMSSRTQIDDGLATTDRLHEIRRSFAALDASLGTGRDREHAADLA